MIRTGILALALSLTLNGCNGQIKDEKSVKTENPDPNTHVSVNKEFDDNGNLIRYDSTYSYFYSNIKDDTLLEDSILNAFKEHFNHQYNFSTQSFFNNLFFEDSLLFYDFYKDEFFSNRFQQNMEFMNDLFKEMDSLKNSFYFKQFKTYQPKDQAKNEKR